MNVLLLFFTAIFAAQAIPLESEWLKYKLHHEKNYAPTEDRLRFSIYQSNLKTIEEHNRKYKQGLVTYEMGINHFTDWTTEEFVQKLKKIPSTSGGVTVDYQGGVPDALNWTENGAVTPVIDEGDCASWIYPIVGSVEGANFLRTNQLTRFSAQYLKDCTLLGCNGGTPSESFDLIQNHGIPVADNYPDPRFTGKCKYGEWDSAIWVKDWIKVQDGNETALQYATAFGGPVTVQIDASGFQFYKSGIFYDDQCSPDIYNLVVLVVGYGTEDNLDYWIVKNAWGTYWGENGYIRMIRNEYNQCGIASNARVPILS